VGFCQAMGVGFANRRSPRVDQEPSTSYVEAGAALTRFGIPTEPTHVMDLVTELLRVCAAGRVELKRLASVRGAKIHMELKELQARYLAALGEPGSAGPPKLTSMQLAVLQEVEVSGFSELLRARALSKALEEFYSPRTLRDYWFNRWCPNNGDVRTLRAGDVIPAFNAVDQLGTRGRSSAPDELEFRPDWLTSLRLLPDGLWFDVDLCNHLNCNEFPYRKSIVFGAALPNPHAIGSPGCEVEVKAIGGFFTHIGPNNETLQRDRFERLIAFAQAEPKVDVLVFPELSSPSTLPTFGQTQPMVTVWGSLLESIGSDLVINRAAVELAGERTHRLHEKLTHFRTKTDWESHTSSRPRLQILAVRDFSICALICKDAFDSDVLKCLETFGVCLILVPALSHKSDPFMRALNHLKTSAQSIVFVVNNCSYGTDACAAMLSVPDPGAIPDFRLSSPQAMLARYQYVP